MLHVVPVCACSAIASDGVARLEAGEPRDLEAAVGLLLGLQPRDRGGAAVVCDAGSARLRGATCESVNEKATASAPHAREQHDERATWVEPP